MYTKHVSKFCHVCATISFKVMVISTLFADLGSADNGRNERPPPKSPLLVHRELKEVTWAAARRFSMWVGHLPQTAKWQSRRRILLKTHPRRVNACATLVHPIQRDTWHNRHVITLAQFLRWWCLSANPRFSIIEK